MGFLAHRPLVGFTNSRHYQVLRRWCRGTKCDLDIFPMVSTLLISASHKGPFPYSTLSCSLPLLFSLQVLVTFLSLLLHALLLLVCMHCTITYWPLGGSGKITYKPQVLGSNTELQLVPHLDEQSSLYSLRAYGALCLNHPEDIIELQHSA